MNIEVIPHAGWGRNLRLANSTAELIVTLDVGPRIISFRTHEGANVFKNYDEQMGGSGEDKWKIRGGHRLWVAPESDWSYDLDNDPVEFRTEDNSDEILIENSAKAPTHLHKTLGITMTGEDSHVIVRHTIRNAGQKPHPVASWGLSVMNSGGMEIIPQPMIGEHPRDLLPNRGMVLWAYTDMSDPRWLFGRDFFTLRQQEGYPPTKIGLAHREKWIAYVLNESLFIKTFDYIEGAIYPDGGCNFETFSNDEMLEIESLSPLVTLAPGESVSHTEHWYLFHLETETQIDSEEALGNWLRPFLKKAGL